MILKQIWKTELLQTKRELEYPKQETIFFFLLLQLLETKRNKSKHFRRPRSFKSTMESFKIGETSKQKFEEQTEVRNRSKTWKISYQSNILLSRAISDIFIKLHFHTAAAPKSGSVLGLIIFRPTLPWEDLLSLKFTRKFFFLIYLYLL